MKKITLLFLGVSFLYNCQVYAQDERDRVITTAVPFLIIAADARAAGLGDQGVATTPDAFSQQWNPAKYAFSESEQGVGVSYTPYLSNIVNDIFLGNLTYFYRLDERSAVAGSLRYFSLGSIETQGIFEEEPLVLSPNEMTLDLSYSLRLSETFSMAVAGRYLRSDLKLAVNSDDATAASTFGVDVAAFYQTQSMVFSNFDGRFRAGANISNIGPKIKYDEVGQENFIPTNLKAGAGFDFLFDTDNRLGTYFEFNKLLVPTPQDFDDDGDIDRTDEEEYNNIGAIKGIFKSFGDAPGGFGEESREITWALGAEYVFREAFALRTGYFNESDTKGARKFIALGAGFKYAPVLIDISYLFSTSEVVSPLEGTLRFGLTFNFGDKYTDL